MWRYLTQFHEFLHFWLDFGSMSISVHFWLEFWLDFGSMSISVRYWLDFGSMSISVCCAGPRLGSCNKFVTPKLGFLQLKWLLAEASGLNLLNFQN